MFLINISAYYDYTNPLVSVNDMKCPLTIYKSTENELLRHSIFLFIKYFIQIMKISTRFFNNDPISGVVGYTVVGEPLGVAERILFYQRNFTFKVYNCILSNSIKSS